jgi:hypothetical protein
MKSSVAMAAKRLPLARAPCSITLQAMKPNSLAKCNDVVNSCDGLTHVMY